MNVFVSLLGKLDRLMERIEVTIVAFSIIAIALNSIANVIGRYVFSYGIYFTEELNQFLMVLVTFIGLSYVTRKGRHIRMSAIYDVLDDRIKKALMMVICLSTAIVLFLLAYYSYEYIAKLAMRGKVSPALRVPVYLTMLCLPIGFVLTGIQYLLTFVQNLRSEHIFLSFTEIDTYEGDEIEVELVSDGKSEASNDDTTLVAACPAYNNKSIDS